MSATVTMSAVAASDQRCNPLRTLPTTGPFGLRRRFRNVGEAGGYLETLTRAGRWESRWETNPEGGQPSKIYSPLNN